MDIQDNVVPKLRVQEIHVQHDKTNKRQGGDYSIEKQTLIWRVQDSKTIEAGNKIIAVERSLAYIENREIESVTIRYGNRFLHFPSRFKNEIAEALKQI